MPQYGTTEDLEQDIAGPFESPPYRYQQAHALPTHYAYAQAILEALQWRYLFDRVAARPVYDRPPGQADPVYLGTALTWLLGKWYSNLLLEPTVHSAQAVATFYETEVLLRMLRRRPALSPVWAALLDAAPLAPPV